MEKEFEEELRRAWAERAAAARQAREQRREAAWQKARAMAQFLRKEYGVGQTYLYGSLAWGPRFGERSDIDLLVEGFPPAAGYWRMLVELEQIASPFEANVALAEDARPELREKAKRDGISL
ncbi:MAG: hypothetical protein QMC81_03385 [Thermoanaerobacterales bacterium]|nr:nucleotidyltransferase domain-containing protein [Bacillota bacterium]MDI6906522.1 hypothetical protein [Thermoanaerobacterales bacterium]